MWPPPKPPIWPPPPPPPCPPPPPPPPRACASVARRLPASSALAKIIITRPLMTFSFWDGRDFPPQGLVRRWRVRGRQMPTSRWSEDEDTDLSLPLNSRSITRSAIAGVFPTPEI